MIILVVARREARHERKPLGRLCPKLHKILPPREYRLTPAPMHLPSLAECFLSSVPAAADPAAAADPDSLPK